MKPINEISSNQVKQTYFFYSKNRKKAVDPALNQLAEKIDANGDGVISDQELKAYLSKDSVQILKYAPDPNLKSGINLYQVDQERVITEYKQSLTGKPAVPQGYHSYEEINENLKSLAERYPDKAQLVSLGKTYEHRDIWALKIGDSEGREASQKPGLVITGATHAREWPTPEITLNLANRLLEEYSSDPEMKNRVDNTEIWLVPVANPDGFVFTRTKYNMWRKNHRPIEQTACDLLNQPQEPPQKPSHSKVRQYNLLQGIGVDINRNYYDGNPEHFHLYRAPGDDPCSTKDDPWGTSDDPNSECYRGPAGASEAETKALTELELNTPNIKGVLDFHSYGGMILIPSGYTTEPVENLEEYLTIGHNMQKAMGGRYRLMPSHDLYATYGNSNDMHHINGKIGMTMEVGSSFQPAGKQLQQTVEEVTKAALSFIDHFAEQNQSEAKRGKKNEAYLQN